MFSNQDTHGPTAKGFFCLIRSDQTTVDLDTAGNSLTNAQELLLVTNLQDPYTDGFEVEASTDPKNPADFPVQAVSISRRSYGFLSTNPTDALPIPLSNRAFLVTPETPALLDGRGWGRDGRRR